MILEAIFNGEIYPAETVVPKSEKFREAGQAIADTMRYFEQTLSEYDELEQAHNTTYGEFKTVRDDLHRLWKVKSCVDTAARFNERTEEQKLQNRPQTRHKKEDMTR